MKRFLKKSLKTIVICSTFISLSGCFNQASVEEKARSIASLWNSGDASEASLDFSQLRLGTPQTIDFELEDGSYCVCKLTSTGEDVSGSLSISSCTYSDSNMPNPGCMLLAGSYTFRSQGTSLEVCDQNKSCYLY